jgi:hypothetical protein
MLERVSSSYRSADSSETICLLRWPTPSEEAAVPVVRVREGLLGMRLLAPDALTYAHRIAVEEDVAGGRESAWVRQRAQVAAVLWRAGTGGWRAEGP